MKKTYHAEHDGVEFTRTTDRTYTHVIICIETEDEYNLNLAHIKRDLEWAKKENNTLWIKRYEERIANYPPGPTWSALTWAGRPDLAEKALARERNRAARCGWAQVISIPCYLIKGG